MFNNHTLLLILLLFILLLYYHLFIYCYLILLLLLLFIYYIILLLLKSSSSTLSSLSLSPLLLSILIPLPLCPSAAHRQKYLYSCACIRVDAGTGQAWEMSRVQYKGNHHTLYRNRTLGEENHPLDENELKKEVFRFVYERRPIKITVREKGSGGLTDRYAGIAGVFVLEGGVVGTV